MRIFKSICFVSLFAAVLFGGTQQAHADDLIGAYVAYIGPQDLTNSKGARLREPWQILRQDRANYHRYGISQSGDEWDPFFGSIDNRAVMEKMVMNGKIDPRAARNLVEGGATVFVRIYGRGSLGTSVHVTVAK
ncbi:hypothetical protein O2N63_05825 [Aliiroseovarius sp. KMU-50]|uniref:Uncharacterized protein n=1 Tax=Aliiroseovarius salicola TaxID=3009082 RepID=A0ABT4VZC9_9RHOB|nr:hypothetical protein [Aliiroseovarius sp. KMU-50]MDA5093605.1 hypothetical protein [Aliiroseovarius sp. KMU-50]